MARSQLKSLFASLESHDLDDSANEAGVDSMESAVLDVQEAYDEAEEASQDVEDLTEISEGLESIVESLEASLEQGGLDATAAQFAHHAIGSYTERLGMESTDVVPGLESFGGDTGRQSATTVSMEGLAETLKKIWAAVKAAVEKAITAVTNFFAKIFGGVDKIISRAEALQKKVSDLSGSPKSKKMTVPNPNSLQVGGEVSMTAIQGGLSNLVMLNNDVFGDHYLSTAKAEFQMIAKQIGELKDENEEKDAEAAISKILSTESTLIKSLNKANGKVVSGHKSLIVTAKAKTDGEGDLDVSSKMRFGNAVNHKSVQNAEIDTPSQGELSNVLKAILVIAKNIKDSKSKIEDIKKARQDAVKAGNDIIKASDRGRVGKVWAKAKGQVVLRMAQRDVTKPATQVAAHDFATARAALAFVEKATKAYGKGDSNDSGDSSDD